MLNENTPILGQHQSTANFFKFHGNKWATALLQFPYFRNLSDHNLKWEIVIIYRERKNNTVNSGRFFFSNAAWFLLIITWTKQSRTFYIYGWVASLPLLVLGSVYVGQSSTIRFVGSWISFLDSLFFPGWLFRWMESINVAGILQEAGDTDLRACTRSQI